ncbi:hypothetical protein QG141_09885, partial [Kingella kingae]|nr:hypothetical protein [Kingella kingae]
MPDCTQHSLEIDVPSSQDAQRVIMSTIMEKDVLIEVVASGLALISRKLKYNLEYLNNNEDNNKFSVLNT